MVRTGENGVSRKLTPSNGSIRAAFRGLIKALALRRGLLIRRVPPGRHGDAFADQARLLAATEVRTVLDVGAYRGETALLYRRLFSNAEIHCFEPTVESFTRLSEATGDDPGIVANQLAVSDVTGPVKLYVNRFAATNSRLRPAINAGEIVPSELLDSVGRVTAVSTTIDDYCVERCLDRVEVLKLDIQGGELAALRGGERMFAEHRIALVYTELLVAPIYEGQGTLGDVLGALEQYDYRLYGLYNLTYGRDSSLYQMDALLVSPDLDLRG